MKLRVGLLAVTALLALIGVSIWATGHVALSPVIDDLLARPAAGNNPWLIATLFDAYFAFLWFWTWVAYREPTWVRRGVWLMLILLIGNMAIAAYILIALAQLPKGANVEMLLRRRSPAA